MVEKKTDPISPWFTACEDLGEYIGIRFGRLAPGSSEPEWFFLRHIDFDGIGGFAELLRRRGAQLPRLPQIKHPSPPSWLPLLNMLPKFLTPRQKVKWQPLERDPEVSKTPQPPRAVAWHIFDETSTTQIRRACRKNAFTINSFLLKHLTKAIRPFLDDESSVVPWMVPVNVRGKVFRERDTANFTSYVGIKIRSYERVHDVHQSIYAALGRGEHWANWYAYKASAWTTLGMKKFMIKNDLAMSQWNLGSFSNLGDWDADKTISSPDCAGGWLFAPPVLRCQLIGAGCVTFQNRLSVAIQAHPDLTTSPNIARAWMQNWIKEIEMDLSSILDLQGSPDASPAKTPEVRKTGSHADSREAALRL
jgi:hypothetical protein